MKRFSLVLLSVFMLLATVVLALAAPGPGQQGEAALAATRYIDTKGWNFQVAPYIPNNCLSATQPCLTLGWAVNQANPGDSILAGCGVYEANETVKLDKDLDIASLPAGSKCATFTTTSGRVLELINDAEVALRDVKVTGGDAGTARGGGVRVAAGSKLTLNSVTVNGNKARVGGGIYATGDVVVFNSLFRNNVAAERGGGLRIRASGTLLLDDSAVTENDAQHGGAIFADGPVEIRNDSRITLNDASGDGGAIVSTGQLTIEDTLVQANTAVEDGGGIAVRAAGTLTVRGSTIRNNLAEAGGGLYVEGSAFLTNGSWLQGNDATYGGGALLFTDGALSVENSSISANTDTVGGGGVFSAGTLTIVGSTVKDNESDGLGGGIRSTGGSLTASNSTFSGNSAEDGAAIASNAAITLTNVTIADNSGLTGGGLYNGDHAFAIVGNVLLSSNQPNDCFTASGATLFVGLGNLDGDGSCPGFPTGDAHLGPLADNGGQTLTHLPGSGSMAIDAGNNNLCAALGNVDQRGFSRLGVDGNGIPWDGNACDIGAVERNATLLPNLDPVLYLPLIVKE